jgi:RNA polymerase sigma-70 factor (ECF subfamily)
MATRPDQSASRLESIYREEGGRMWRSLLAFTGDREIARDAVAEAFAQALRRGAALRDPRAWTWRSAFRIASGELKALRRWVDRSPEAETPEHPLDAPIEVAEALARLSPAQRAVILLHHYAGFRDREIAGILDTTTSAVKMRLVRARRRLRELLEDADE